MSQEYRAAFETITDDLIIRDHQSEYRNKNWAHYIRAELIGPSDLDVQKNDPESDKDHLKNKNLEIQILKIHNVKCRSLSLSDLSRYGKVQDPLLNF